MITAVWSAKGGVGTSTVAALLALARAHRVEATLLIDLCGDQPSVLGLTGEPGALGVTDWLASSGQTAEALERIAEPAGPELALVAMGTAPLLGDTEPLLRASRELNRMTVIDCGRLDEGQPTDAGRFRRAVVATAPNRLVVVRPCYLGLRALQRIGADLSPTGVVTVVEAGRALQRCDIEAVAGAPVVAEIAVDPSVARVVDAGMLTTRLPRRLVRSLAKVPLDVAA